MLLIEVYTHYYSIFDRKRKKEIQLSQVSLIIVFGTILRSVLCNQFDLLMLFNVAVFIFCHSFKWVPNLWELLQTQMSDQETLEWPQWIGDNRRRREKQRLRRIRLAGQALRP